MFDRQKVEGSVFDRQKVEGSVFDTQKVEGSVFDTQKVEGSVFDRPVFERRGAMALALENDAVRWNDAVRSVFETRKAWPRETETQRLQQHDEFHPLP